MRNRLTGWPKRRPDVRDAYFIFADDVFTGHMTYGQFTTILKFYLLIYRRVLIADSFLLNNAHLHKFLLEEVRYCLKRVSSYLPHEQISWVWKICCIILSRATR